MIVSIASQPEIDDAALSQLVEALCLRDDIAIVHADNFDGLRSAASDSEEAQLAATIFAYLRTGGANLTPEARKEFTDGAVEQLLDMPLHLVLEALRSAPRKVRYPSELLPYIDTTIKKSWDGRLERYRELEAVARRVGLA